jgi:hypothetical protein
MTQRDDTLMHTDAGALADLFAISEDAYVPWTESDQGAMLRHQLQQPLDGAAEDSPTIAALLSASSPSIDALQQLKHQAKAGIADDTHLPRDVSTVLYYAALAAAQRAGQPITRLDPQAFKEGLDWALDLPWLTPQLRTLFAETRAALARS